MSASLLSNRFLEKNSPLLRQKSFTSFATSISQPPFKVVQDGAMMDPFYRSKSERAHAGREQHLGVDITGPKAGDGSLTDPRRGLPVYATINTIIPLSDLNSVRAFDKPSGKEVSGVNLQGSGDAAMNGAKVFLQPWLPTDGNSYGGIVGISCFYSYKNNSGNDAEFTLYIEFLHLITDRFLPKDKSGKVATAEEWHDTGRGIGFGPALQNNLVLDPVFFLGPTYSIIGYLGATQTPHVHIQVAFYNSRTESKSPAIRIDPMVAVY
jgi:hypothetical protein